jgi:hypothetical protein
MNHKKKEIHVMDISQLNVHKTEHIYTHKYIKTQRLQSINKIVKNTIHQSTLTYIPIKHVKRLYKNDRFIGKVATAGLENPYNRYEQEDIMLLGLKFEYQPGHGQYSSLPFVPYFQGSPTDLSPQTERVYSYLL